MDNSNLGAICEQSVPATHVFILTMHRVGLAAVVSFGGRLMRVVMAKTMIDTSESTDSHKFY